MLFSIQNLIVVDLFLKIILDLHAFYCTWCQENVNKTFLNLIDGSLCYDFILKYLIEVTKFYSSECFENLLWLPECIIFSRTWEVIFKWVLPSAPFFFILFQSFGKSYFCLVLSCFNWLICTVKVDVMKTINHHC